MAQTIKLKRSATQNQVPTTGQLELGEVAINTYDGKMFIKKDTGTTETPVESIVEIGAGGGSLTELDLDDNQKIKLGTGDDFEIYHTDTNNESIIKESGDGDLKILADNLRLRTSADDKDYIYCTDASGVGFYHSGSLKAATSGSGFSVTGTTATDALVVGNNVSITAIVDEDDMSSDSASNLATQQSIKAYVDSKAPYRREKYRKLAHDQHTRNLNTVYSIVTQAPYIYTETTPVKCSRYLDIQFEIEWFYVSSTTNDLTFKLEMTVPTSSATVTNLGTATRGPFTGHTEYSYEDWIYVSGDYTHLLTEFGRMNKTGTSGASEIKAYSWYYDSTNDRTYILTDSNPGISVSTGDTLYWHPYAWESAGTLLYVEENVDERYNSGRQHHSLLFKTAYDDSAITYRIFMKEVASTDSGKVRDVKCMFTDVEEV